MRIQIISICFSRRTHTRRIQPNVGVRIQTLTKHVLYSCAQIFAPVRVLIFLFELKHFLRLLHTK